MLYHLIQYLERSYDIPGQQMFLSISFRTGVGFILALLVATVFGRKIINRLQKMQIGETIRDLGMEDQLKKKGTPTMGGIIIILAILVPTLLLADLTNIYIIYKKWYHNFRFYCKTTRDVIVLGSNIWHNKILI